ncbi:putative adenylyltransferase/sulfurtransferase MoeZ [Planctomycetes bacterium Pla163]|uniref:Molybdopterin-synthase adenylyltransferase n=1 Tax=Rohdeia mirabilis TaxID=2528008 RepID=A0A518CWL1_9BACT|nr:putative adenylyltransferase/sulfurtransferase MoeZ [Planctomycetes bacterium Pla163]
MSTSRERLDALRAALGEVEPRQAAGDPDGVVLDVREPDETSQGSPTGALRVPKSFLELRVEEALPDRSRPVYVLCAGGVRSLFATEALRALGYERAVSVAGGFSRWKADGLAFEVPRALDAAGRVRYGRQVILPEVGEEGQLALGRSRAVLVGAGGLGSPAAYYLAAAGVGELVIVDDDVVDRSNLHRQILHTDARVGRPKVESAKQTLEALNPDVRVDARRVRLVPENVEEVFAGADVVLDGTDNFQTRYLVNDACVNLGIANVHGAIFRFEGQVSVFHPARERGVAPCYRCLYPEPPPPELAPSCAEAGVLGVLPGVIGCLQGIEAIKLLLGIGEPLIGRMLHYDALRQRFQELTFGADPKCTHCAPDAPVRPYQTLAESCGA